MWLHRHYSDTSWANATSCAASAPRWTRKPPGTGRTYTAAPAPLAGTDQPQPQTRPKLTASGTGRAVSLAAGRHDAAAVPGSNTARTAQTQAGSMSGPRLGAGRTRGPHPAGSMQKMAGPGLLGEGSSRLRVRDGAPALDPVGTVDTAPRPPPRRRPLLAVRAPGCCGSTRHMSLVV